MTAWLLLLVVPPALVVVMTLVNWWTWRRPVPLRAPEGAAVAVLVPARNEAHNLGDCLERLRDGQADVASIVVCDDGSEDATAEVARRAAAHDSRVTVFPGAPLPNGWVGKPHACHQLATRANEPYLLFLDADVRLEPGAVAALLAVVRETGADVVSAAPRQRAVGWFEKLAMPFLVLSYVAWLPLRLVELSPRPSVLAANGQVLLVRRRAYDDLGGFAAVRGDIVDDMAFCRRAKAMGRKVVFVDGQRIATTRMYETPAALWRGFSKNLYPGIGARPLNLALVLALYILALGLPFVCLVAPPVPQARLPAAVGVGLILLARALMAIRYQHAAWAVVAHPLGLLVFIAVALNSLRWWVTGRLLWAGRSYRPDALREVGS